MNRLAQLLQAKGCEVHRPLWNGLQLVAPDRRIVVTVQPVGDNLHISYGLTTDKIVLCKPWKAKQVVKICLFGWMIGVR